MSGCATVTHRAGAPRGAVDVVGHRGASAYAPENTLASFALAKEMGADWFELDCTLTKDGEVIVIHDDKLDRTTDGTGEVSHYTLAELKRLDAGSKKAPEFAGERLPTLAEALDLAKQKRIGIYIEIKNGADDRALIKRIMEMAGDSTTLTPAMKRKMMALIRASGTRNLELTRKVIALIKKHRMSKNVVIQSFSPIVCAIALNEAPRIRTEMLALKDKDDPQRWPFYLKWAGLVPPRGFNTNPDCITQALLHDFHAQGMTVSLWTVDDENDVRQFAQWGVDRLITNKPDVCLKVLKDIGKHP